MAWVQRIALGIIGCKPGVEEERKLTGTRCGPEIELAAATKHFPNSKPHAPGHIAKADLFQTSRQNVQSANLAYNLGDLATRLGKKLLTPTATGFYNRNVQIFGASLLRSSLRSPTAMRRAKEWIGKIAKKHGKTKPQPKNQAKMFQSHSIKLKQNADERLRNLSCVLVQLVTSKFKLRAVPSNKHTRSGLHLLKRQRALEHCSDSQIRRSPTSICSICCSRAHSSTNTKSTKHPISTVVSHYYWLVQ